MVATERPPLRIFVTGAKGMLGQEFVLAARDHGHFVLATDVSEFNILDRTDLTELAEGKRGKFDWIVNCAAYTAVDKAESEPEIAQQLNGLGPGLLASAASTLGARMVHISTDFVFDGRASEPLTEATPVAPLGIYGKTKRAGEELVLHADARSIVCRTSWLFGAKGKSFPLTMIRAWLAGKPLRVVADQIGTPTFTGDLSRVILDLIESKADGGIYHTAGPDVMSWRDFAERAILSYQLRWGVPGEVKIEGIKTTDWPTPAARPAYSALAFERCASLGIAPMRGIEEQLADFVAELRYPLAEPPTA